MISQTMVDAYNEQINAEMYSAYLYMSMGTWFEDNGLKGCASWMRVQALEEMTHAEKFVNYVQERGGRVLLKAIAGPETQWADPMSVFQAVADHEAHVTSLINALVDLAEQEKDHASKAFLQWFVTEQVEEEASAAEILGQLKLTASAPGGLFMIDKELGQRTFVPPTTKGN